MEFNKLIPELSVKDINKSKEFYLEILEFQLIYERVEEKFAFISLNGAQIMIEECNGHWQTGELEYPYGRGINFQIEVENIESILQNLKRHKIALFRESMLNNYSGFIQKEFIVQDPDGYLLRFSQPC
ncbi:VOC family protein [Priestia megaterium]|uniref:bleomycin resistance protein n=1 Tax=Priestia megaterium TaxID=1404 RepID=UPI0021C1C2F7|nr:VOC family protein [Priestia megaterium]MCT9853357.1 VOC family protein [Priestia megaterium]MDF1964386.1 VOC family protein [Priestia megaterium]